MGALKQNNGIIVGCEVAAPMTPDMTLNANPGRILFGNKLYAVSSATLTFGTADAVLPRWDLIEIDPSSGFVVTAGTPTAPDSHGVVPRPAENTARVYRGAVFVGAGVTSITNDNVDLTKDSLEIVQPADSLLFTYDYSSTSASDPGTGYFRFDGTSNNAISHIYISYFTPSSPSLGAGGIKETLQQGKSLFHPYWIRLWNASDPGSWWLGQVTAFTDHTTWGDLTVTWVDVAEPGNVGAPGGHAPPLGTDAFEISLEVVGFIPAPPSAPPSGVSNLTAADVTLSSSNTFFDILDTGSLPAGTYQIHARYVYSSPTAGHIITARLFDGSTTYAETSHSTVANNSISGNCSAIITIASSATIKLQAATNLGTSDKIGRAAQANSSGNYATSLSWMQIV